MGQPGRALVRDAGAGESEGNAGEGEDGHGAVRGVHTAGRERTKLSQLLFKLVSDTRLHQVGCGPRGHADQQAALYKAARGAVQPLKKLALATCPVLGLLSLCRARIAG